MGSIPRTTWSPSTTRSPYTQDSQSQYTKKSPAFLYIVIGKPEAVWEHDGLQRALRLIPRHYMAHRILPPYQTVPITKQQKSLLGYTSSKTGVMSTCLELQNTAESYPRLPKQMYGMCHLQGWLRLVTVVHLSWCVEKKQDLFVDINKLILKHTKRVSSLNFFKKSHISMIWLQDLP